MRFNSRRMKARIYSVKASKGIVKLSIKNARQGFKDWIKEC